MADSKISALTALTAPADGDKFVTVDVSDTSEAATGTDKSITYGTLAGNLCLAGTAAGIPGASTVPAGTFYFSTDTNVLQRSNGTTWVSCGVGLGAYTTKGDILVATGAGVTFNQGVSATDGQYLAVSSAASTGVAWRGSATSMLPLTPPILGTLTSTATGATNTWYALRFGVPVLTTFTGIRIVTGTTANGNMRAALYASDTTTKLADKTSDAAQAAAGNITSLAFDSSYDAIPNIYYALVWFSSATATFLGGRYATLASTGTNATTTPANVGTPAFSASLTKPQFSLY